MDQQTIKINVEEIKSKINKVPLNKNNKEPNKNTKNESENETESRLNIWRILGYFIIYSILGFTIETIYGVLTKGRLESRQSFLYGPFCGIYGLGAVIAIICLYKYRNKSEILFFGGFIVGSIVEYFLSYLGEITLGVKWWDYSDMPLNINGRICVYFSLFWGLLSVFLIRYVNPKLDKFISILTKKFSIKKLKIAVISIFIFLIIDFIITGIATSFFLIRMINENNLDVPGKEEIAYKYNEIYSNEKLAHFINTVWSNKKMIRTFPNLKIKDNNNNIIYFDGLLPDIQPYYFKFFDK